MIHTHHHYTRRHLSPNTSNNIDNNNNNIKTATNYSTITTTNAESIDATASVAAEAAFTSRPLTNKKSARVDWTVRDFYFN